MLQEIKEKIRNSIKFKLNLWIIRIIFLYEFYHFLILRNIILEYIYKVQFNTFLYLFFNIKE